MSTLKFEMKSISNILSILLIPILLIIILLSLLEPSGILLSHSNPVDITKQGNPFFNITKAEMYLVKGYNTHYGLIKENENIDKYWLWSDNILASEAIKDYNYPLYANITNTIRNFIQHYHISFHSAWQALIDPTSVVQSPSFGSPTNINVINNIWYSNYNGSVELQCADYADIAFLKSIYFYEINEVDQSKTCYNAGANMFDGVGFKDKAFISDGFKYSTYKVALWKIASNITGFTKSKEISKVQDMIIGREQDKITGGEYTYYLASLIPSNETNVETTSIAIIANKGGLDLPRPAE
jgi:hypothetical protein